ncbi:MAG: right-handed parallel beta-helix repeat-containing protein [Candidatus Zixiibacteriota bacterium]|nr:MAG: right-handed parallel beta-helix repeat-containing protein [candidate division Zixibacteria bacterium]
MSLSKIIVLVIVIPFGAAISVAAAVNPETNGGQGGGGQQAGLADQGMAPTVDYAIVDDDFTSQADVDVYNSANGTSFVYGLDAFGSIQAGVDAVDGSTVYVLNGTYVETIDISKDLTLTGQSRTGVIIDCSSLSDYGIWSDAQNITFENFTVRGSTSPTVGIGIKIEGDITVVAIGNVAVQSSGLSGIDINGANFGALYDISVTNNGAVGLKLTDCRNVTISDITTIGNASGGIGILSDGTLFTGGSDNITLTGSNSFSETTGLFTQEGGGYPITSLNIPLTEFSFIVSSNTAPEYQGYYPSFAAATAVVLGGSDPLNSYIIDRATLNFKVVPGMTIQAAVDAASDGDSVHATAGSYEEQVEIDKDIQLYGDGMGSTIIESPVTLPLYFTTSANNYPVVYVHDASDVRISWLTVDGLGRGNTNQRFYGIAYFNAGGMVDHVEVKNIQDTPFGLAQHGLGIYRFDDDGLAYSMTISNCSVHDFQKNGITINGSATAAITVDIHGNTVIGEGAITDLAQNGIQVWGDLISGDIDSNTVSGIAFDNTGSTIKWMASSIINYYADVDIYGNTISEGHLGIYNIDGAGLIDGNDVSIEKVGVYAWGIVATDPVMAVPSPYSEESMTSDDERASGSAATAVLDVDVTGNTVTFSGPDNSMTWGIEADAGYAVDDLDFTAAYNDVSGFEVGIVVYNCVSSCGTGVFTSAQVLNNYLSANDIGVETNEQWIVVHENHIDGTVGIQNDLAGTTIDASRNYFGSTDPATVAGLMVGDVDYTPYLGGGTLATPGFDGYFSDLYIDDDSPQSGSETRLNEAIDLVTASTIYVAAGTYAEGPQVHVNKDIEVIGDDHTTVKFVPTVSTGSSGDAGGWFLVDSGVTFDLSHVELDGSGEDIYQAIRILGGGLIDHVDFHNIVYPSYSGVAISAVGYDNVTITNCDFANCGRTGALLYGNGLTNSAFSYNTYTGKGDGDWLDYAADIGAGANVAAVGNTVSNCTGVALSDGSTSAGFLVSTYYGVGTSANLESNSISDCAFGLTIGHDDDDSSVVSVTDGNSFVDNDTGIGTTASSGISLTVFGNNLSNAVNAVDDAGGTWDDGVAVGNCWSDFVSNLGYPFEYQVGGSGGGVDAYPNRGDCGAGFDINDIVYYCDGNIDFEVRIASDITGMEVGAFIIQYPSQLSPVSITPSSANLSLFTSTFNGNSSNPDTLIVDVSVLSGSQDGPATLFTVAMSGSQDVCTDGFITLLSARYRQSDNIDIYPTIGAPISLTADCSDPVFTLNSPTSGGIYNTAPVFDISVTDNCEIDAIYFQVDNCAGGSWTAMVTEVGSGAYNDTEWVFPDFATVADQASHCIYFKVMDVNGRGNADSCSVSFCFAKDVIPPAPPAEFTAAPGHNKIQLNWVNPGDTDVVGIKVQRNSWDDYPDYVTPPDYPGDPSAGTNVYSGLGSAHVDDLGMSNSNRGIHYYTAFACDAAGNYSAAVMSAQDRSTSYWLGDLTDATTAVGAYDGYVYFGDLARFSIAYGKAEADPGFDGESDFGPTATGNPRGVPEPDDSVGFEDLAIFAINFDAVGPSSKIAPIFAGAGTGGDHKLVLEGQEEDGRLIYTLSLLNNSGELKVLHAVIDLGENCVFGGTELSEEISGSEWPIFHHVTESNDRVTLDLAVLGHGVSIGGSGTLASFRFVSTDGHEPSVKLVEGILRDGENNDLVVELQSLGIGSTPKVYHLAQNYPNPFNPSTTMSFDVPVAGRVLLEIYNTLGRRVSVLVDGHFEPGSYEITWNGNSDAGNAVASGMYFYRMTAGNFTQTRKMILLK